jgi:hypothetical protein
LKAFLYAKSVHKYVFCDYPFIIKVLGKKAVGGLTNCDIKVINTGDFFSYYKFLTYGPGIYFVGLVKNITHGARSKCPWGAK